VAALIAATAEMVRVVKPSGSIWVNLGDKYNARKSLIGIPWRYALACIDELGLILRAEVIWNKPNGLPESVTDRVRRSHETWFHFTPSPRYYANVDEVREPHGSTKWIGRDKQERNNSDRNDGGKMANTANPLGKLPGSVWTIPTQPLTVPDHLGIDHFAAFPMEWPRRIIKGWSPPGGTVLDPFGGTGTVALIADTLGRDAIHIDLSADYCRLAHWRTTDPAQRAAALQVDKPPTQTDGQLTLEETPQNHHNQPQGANNP
jgi:DNA modification methylase